MGEISWRSQRGERAREGTGEDDEERAHARSAPGCRHVILAKQPQLHTMRSDPSMPAIAASASGGGDYRRERCAGGGTCEVVACCVCVKHVDILAP